MPYVSSLNQKLSFIVKMCFPYILNTYVFCSRSLFLDGLATSTSFYLSYPFFCNFFLYRFLLPLPFHTPSPHFFNSTNFLYLASSVSKSFKQSMNHTTSHNINISTTKRCNRRSLSYTASIPLEFYPGSDKACFLSYPQINIHPAYHF
jgi:hypothetical protein